MIKIKRDYLSFPELAERWKLPADSLDIRRALMAGAIRPCIIVHDTLPRVTLVDGDISPVLDADDQPMLDELQGWCFPIYPIQTGPFEALFPVVAKTANPTDADGLWSLPSPLTLSDLLTSAVVMLDDVEGAEAANGHVGTMTTKEENTALKLISVLAADSYGWHDSGRSDTVKTIALAAEAMGLAISSNTVLRFLRRAQSEFPPSADHFTSPSAREADKVTTAEAAPTVVQAKPTDRNSIEFGESQLSCDSA